jgi:hypothetical protein
MLLQSRRVALKMWCERMEIGGRALVKAGEMGEVHCAGARVGHIPVWRKDSQTACRDTLGFRALLYERSPCPKRITRNVNVSTFDCHKAASKQYLLSEYVRVSAVREIFLECFFFFTLREHFIVSCARVTLDGFFLLDIGFTDNLYTQLRITSNYSAIANHLNLQVNTAPAKPLSNLLCLHQSFPGNGF